MSIKNHLNKLGLGVFVIGMSMLFVPVANAFKSNLFALEYKPSSSIELAYNQRATNVGAKAGANRGAVGTAGRGTAAGRGAAGPGAAGRGAAGPGAAGRGAAGPGAAGPGVAGQPTVEPTVNQYNPTYYGAGRYTNGPPGTYYLPGNYCQQRCINNVAPEWEAYCRQFCR